MKKVKQQSTAGIWLFILFFILIQVPNKANADIQEIPVNFYPGSAKVVVEGLPGETISTPGILKLSKTVFRMEKQQRHYALYFSRDTVIFKPIILKPETDRRALTKNICCYGGPLTCIGLYAMSKGQVWKLVPTNIYVIDKIEAEKASKIEPIIQALKSEIAWVRADAAEVLGNIGNNTVVEPLIGALNDKDPEVRTNAAVALGKIGDSKAIEPLISALNDNEFEVRMSSAKSLGKIGFIAIDRLIDLLSNKKLQTYAALALAEIGPQVKSAIPCLIEHSLILKEELTDIDIAGDFYTEKMKLTEFFQTSKQLHIEKPITIFNSLTSSWYNVIKTKNNVVFSINPTKIDVLKDFIGPYLSIDKNKSSITERYYQWNPLNFFDKTHSITETTTIVNFTIDTGLYALHKITGEDFGNNRDKWLQWWEKNKANYQK